MDKDDFIANYMNKQLKKNKLPYGMQYFSWLADERIPQLINAIEKLNKQD